VKKDGGQSWLIKLYVLIWCRLVYKGLAMDFDRTWFKFDNYTKMEKVEVEKFSIWVHLTQDFNLYPEFDPPPNRDFWVSKLVDLNLANMTLFET